MVGKERGPFRLLGRWDIASSGKVMNEGVQIQLPLAHRHHLEREVRIEGTVRAVRTLLARQRGLDTVIKAAELLRGQGARGLDELGRKGVAQSLEVARG